jgi:hypothetical protein
MRKALEESIYPKDDCFRVRCDVTVSTEIRTEGASQFVMVPPSDMNQHIGHLLSSGVEADVTFQVDDETFAAHRLVLGARSSVFMAELFGPMKEKGTGHIRIDDLEPRVFKAMLHFIYTDARHQVPHGSVKQAMVQRHPGDSVLCRRVHAPHLKTACSTSHFHIPYRLTIQMPSELSKNVRLKTIQK